MSCSPEQVGIKDPGPDPNRKRTFNDDSKELNGVEIKRRTVKDEEHSLPPVSAAVKATPNATAINPGQKHGVNSSADKSDSSEAKVGITGPTGHRPVTSCTHCRQHKIKCNASEKFPNPCSRCERMGLKCEIDPRFRPKKGSQLQSLRSDVEELKLKVKCLAYNERLIAYALGKSEWGRDLLQRVKNASQSAGKTGDSVLKNDSSPQIAASSCSAGEPTVIQSAGPNASNQVEPPTGEGLHRAHISVDPAVLNDKSLPRVLRIALKRRASKYTPSPANSTDATSPALTPDNNGTEIPLKGREHVVATTSAMQPLPSPQASVDEFILGDVKISLEKANELHRVFVESFLPYFPIMYSNTALELYSQSHLLFWTVMLTACLSEPEPSLYNRLASLIKQLAIETCWIRTPRSTHISQALLILCTWPLPNQKVLDDCSYRFVGLAKSLSFQLGLHRGKFMSEFTRTQTSMPNAEKWRTRTWLGIFFAEQCWASILGLPPTSQNDHLIELARLREDESAVPSRFRQLICLANFQSTLCETMGSSVTTPDGLLDAQERGGALESLRVELARLQAKLKFEQDTVIEMYFLYVKLMICCFAFLPGTPAEHQKKYVDDAYLSATKVVTLLVKLLETTNLIQLPIYVRQSVTYSALILFKLQSTPWMPEKFVDSARQSVVTVHRLYRNQLTAWTASVENDISRTASVLEKLNFVLITQPEIFMESKGIITRMRSHLTGTLFYDLVWCIHEARRRQADPNYKKEDKDQDQTGTEAESKRTEGKDGQSYRKRLCPLPFYDQIYKEDFETITQTTPGGTTVTTLIPTQTAIQEAKRLANSQGGKKGPIKYINGIPISVLEETGSMNSDAAHWVGDESLNVAAPIRPVTPSSVIKTSATAEDIYPKSPSLFAQSMQRSASTPVAAEILGRGRIPTSTSPPPVLETTHSLFAVNNSNVPNANAQSLSLGRQVIPEFIAPASPLLTSNSYSSLNVFLSAENNMNNGTNSGSLSQGLNKQSSELNTFFQTQSAGWMEQNSANDDDILGWFDINMAPEF
ncbi:LAFA_0D05732g1_1 [Lachancea sp. 'fantastica']|nr:LAFA_0D05732g1_1 [Lachancea sp. 'fantastica']